MIALTRGIRGDVEVISCHDADNSYSMILMMLVKLMMMLRTFPSASTRILSESMMVWSLWAIVSTVQFLNLGNKI